MEKSSPSIIGGVLMKVLSVKIFFAPLRAVFTTFISLITAGWAEDS